MLSARISLWTIAVCPTVLLYVVFCYGYIASIVLVFLLVVIASGFFL